MAGHSRWAQVKHKKAGTDAKRSAVFSKLSRLITIASRDGGTDPTTNAKLRTVMEQARDAGLPKDTIERALTRAAGAAGGDMLVSRSFEAYGPGGSAFLIEAVTDNPNRTTAEVKRILGEFGGKLAAAGSVAWMFERCAIVQFSPVAAAAREAAELAFIDAGALDVEADGDTLTVRAAPEAVLPLRAAAARRGLTIERVSLAMVATSHPAVGADDRARVQSLAALLDDHPDVTAVWTNTAP